MADQLHIQQLITPVAVSRPVFDKQHDNLSDMVIEECIIHYNGR